MIAEQVASLIADFVIFLETMDEEHLNPDYAVDMMENIASHMEEMDKGFLRELVDAFAVIAAKNEGKVAEMIRKIPEDFFLEEALAADDPVRLAELDAIRDARDKIHDELQGLSPPNRPVSGG